MAVLMTVLGHGCTPQSLYMELNDTRVPQTLLIDRGQIEATLAEIEKIRGAIPQDYKNPELFYRAGLLEERLGRWDLALRAFQDATNRNAKFAEAHYHAGYVAEKIGESYEMDPIEKSSTLKRNATMHRFAIDAYHKAIRHKPNFADAYYRLCLAYLLNNDLNRATDMYKKLETLEPNTERTKEALMKVFNLHQKRAQKN
jgi:tetratricopeptide (TPR) repeat protein